MGGGKKLPISNILPVVQMAEIASLGLWYFKTLKNNIMKNINFMDSLNGSNNRIVEVQKVLEQIKIGFWKKQIKDIQISSK